VTMPSYVPSAYQGWVSDAASETGLPVPVVAAQIEEESGFNPNAVSPAGAEGIAQFLPSTYESVGGTGSLFNAQNELQPYITLTDENLDWSGGNVEQALAAYNAGQSNWQAGIGYAETILSNAGLPTTETVSTPPDVDTNTPGGTQQAQTTSFNPLNPLSWLDLFGSGDVTDYLERFGLIVFGGAMILVGLWMLTSGKAKIQVNVPQQQTLKSADGSKNSGAKTSEVVEAAEAAA
jgi:Transglycosylase SLT domain